MPYLSILAVFVILFALATLFTSYTEADPEISATSPTAVGTVEFKRVVESITHSSSQPIDSDIKIFTDGQQFLEDLISEIKSAQSSVTMTNYIFKKGEMANAILDALAEKAGDGIEVRVLIDAFGGIQAPKEKIDKLKEAGGHVAIFRPFSFRAITRLHKRSHMRAIVVDGKVGYTGGLAFQDEWLGDGTAPTQWRDLMFKYNGHMARATQDQFNSIWRQTDGEILSGPKFYPDPVSSTSSNPGSYFVSLLHRPAPDLSSDLLDLIWLSITGARDHIYLATPYLTPEKEITKALKQAVERGVRVEVMVPGPHTDLGVIQAATFAHYENLLKAGLHIYEYQPGRFHEKFMVVDGYWSLVGSANMDERSTILNVENVFGVEDEKLASLLEGEFDHNKNQSKEVTLQTFNPNVFQKTYYKLAYLFARQF